MFLKMMKNKMKLIMKMNNMLINMLNETNQIRINNYLKHFRKTTTIMTMMKSTKKFYHKTKKKMQLKMIYLATDFSWIQIMMTKRQKRGKRNNLKT